MKKYLTVILAIVTISILLCQPIPSLAYEAKEPVADTISIKNHRTIPGTTPRPENNVQLFELSPEEVEISNQIYNNIFKFDPSVYLLTDQGISVANPWGEMTDNEIEWVYNKSKEILKNKKTASDKIRAVAEYVAKNVGYDYDYTLHHVKEYEDLNHTAYDVLTQGFGVCYGYSAAVCGLLQAAGIPCLMINSPNHEWNMAYDGNRWILLDATWMSDGTYEYEQLNLSNHINNEWYDFSEDLISSEYNHLLEGADYTEYDNCIYQYPIYSKALKDIPLPSNVTKIASYAFFNSPLKGTLDLKNVETVESYAFYNSFGIEKIINLKNIRSVGRSAFYKCSAMNGILDLKNVQFIDQYAFYDCKNLSGILLGKHLTTLPYAAFYNCTSVTDLVILGNIESMTDFAISNLLSLKNIYLADTSDRWYTLKNSCYNYIPKNISYMYEYVPRATIAKNNGTSDNITVTFKGIPVNEKAMLCEYKGDQFLGFSYQTLDTELDFTLKNPQADTLRIIIIDDFGSFRPEYDFSFLKL